MKKLLLTLSVILVLPFMVSAHGVTESDSSSDTKATVAKHEAKHQEMESLMKKFMLEGKLSETDADKMITHMNEMMDGQMGQGSMMGDSKDSSTMAGHHGNNEGGMMDGKWQGGMMGNGIGHVLLLTTGVVWLIAGAMFIFSLRRKNVENIS